MQLSDVSIKERQEKDDLITPWDDSQLQPASYDLRISDTFLEPRVANSIFHRIKEPGLLKTSTIKPFVLRSLCFALATTIETVNIPIDLCARVEGKSSLARVGLFIHISAGFIDPGFHGQLTLEMFNASPFDFILEDEMRIAQIAFFMLDKPAYVPYGHETLNSHYQGQRGPVGARF